MPHANPPQSLAIVGLGYVGLPLAIQFAKAGLKVTGIDVDAAKVVKLNEGEGFHLAYSPEREDPSNPESKVERIPKLVGGFSPACLDKALALYGTTIETLVPVKSCRVAEAAKLLENIFRSVNIALVCPHRKTGKPGCRGLLP